MGAKFQTVDIPKYQQQLTIPKNEDTKDPERHQEVP
jgi:hypothetical protein